MHFLDSGLASKENLKRLELENATQRRLVDEQQELARVFL
jgi:hypothetical protein